MWELDDEAPTQHCVSHVTRPTCVQQIMPLKCVLLSRHSMAASTWQRLGRLHSACGGGDRGGGHKPQDGQYSINAAHIDTDPLIRHIERTKYTSESNGCDELDYTVHYYTLRLIL